MKKLDELTKHLNTLNRQLGSKNQNGILLKRIAVQVSKSIRERWKKGLGVKKHGDDPVSFDEMEKLKDTTVKYREYLKSKGDLSNMTSPKKNQLIATGKMYSQLDYKITGNELEIGIFGDRKQVLEYTEENGRPLMNMSKKELEIVEEAVQKHIDDILKNTFK